MPSCRRLFFLRWRRLLVFGFLLARIALVHAGLRAIAAKNDHAALPLVWNVAAPCERSRPRVQAIACACIGPYLQLSFNGNAP